LYRYTLVDTLAAEGVGAHMSAAAAIAFESRAVWGAGADTRLGRVGTFHSRHFAVKTPIHDIQMVHISYNQSTPGSDNPTPG
jgi:hypothetical protein